MAARVIIVTGGGRGIGRAVCRRFAAEKYAVATIARHAGELEETSGLVKSAGSECLTISGDVSRPESVQRLIDETRQRFGRVDVLVNNAGVAPLETVERMSLETYRTCNAVNIDAVFYACKAVCPLMRAGGGGTIVNVASVSAIDPFPGLGTYGAAKAWVVAFTRSLADEVRPDGISVFGVGPGAVDTVMLRAVAPSLPVNEMLTPEDVADTVFELTAPAWRHASGQTIFVRR
ncbi:MAG TPA: SDR family oxidoreductase [Phycisphaerae bacterium]